MTHACLDFAKFDTFQCQLTLLLLFLSENGPQPDINTTQEVSERGDKRQLGELSSGFTKVIKAVEQGEERDIWITMDEVAGNGTVKVRQEDEEPSKKART